MEALNGMTMFETLYDELAADEELVNMSPISPPNNVVHDNWTGATGLVNAD